MPKLTLSQAARVTGRSKTQIGRMIENGKLSKEESGAGGYVIDASELLRVYPDADLKRTASQRSGSTQGDKRDSTVTAVQDARLELITGERDRLRAELDEARRELRTERDSSAAERDRLLKIVEAAQRQLTDQTEKARAVTVTPPVTLPVAKRGWWPFR